MGQDAGLKREDHSRLGTGPGISQTSCCVNEENESRNRRYHQLKCSDSNSGELSLDYVPNFHCRSLPTRSRKTSTEQSIVGKRGSMYQSSSEISRIRKIQEGRRKIDSAFGGDAFLLFDIVDASSRPSTSGAYLHSHRNQRSGAKSSVETTHRINRASKDFLDLSFRELPDDNFKLDRPRLDSTMLKNDGGDGFLEISFEKEITDGGPCRGAAPYLLDVESGKCTETDYQLKTSGCPSENNHGERGRDSASSSKSMSEKISSSDDTCRSGSVQHHIIENNTKARSSPFKKMLDPIMKSKSRRSPSLAEKGDPNSITGPGSRKNSMSRKSLLGDFSRTEQASSCQPIGETQRITSALSPAHLQAVLRLDSKNGVQVSEFCVEGLEESISARNWKTGDELNSIYTLHSGGKRSSAAGRISKDGGWNLPPIVGQLQVSSYLCSEVGKDGMVNNSVITEFVSYDIAHARRIVEKTQCTEAPQQPLCSAIDKSMSGESPQMINLMDQHKIGRNNSDVSTSCPWSEEDLYPHLEIAATVIEVPFSKDKSKDMKNGSSPCSVKVVTPTGLHGLPSESGASPSPLLDRWRYGGGCDCGGWDMACPIDVLGNAYDDNWAESITTNAKHPMELFVEGSKEELPALSMKANGKGQFLVDFHARLSALQAFSVCISLLHCSEASIAISIEKGKHKLYSNSLKLLLEEDVRHLIEAVTAEEKKQQKKSRRRKAPPSVVLDPPFSPIGRV
ncbi:hypothetical protein SEVIR_5G039800v4 [Setaria viridis]|uniref:DUF3527 domain-containing protein n=2 Tax=Setaria TaxID=4554 RepID=K3XEX4_SETIT|nr:uncharacterized protein LOC101778673 [Setaria italica]XP_034597981.1 uncharacterized protein LOC117858931 [Setaria viridis]RCV23902.1 hypothetical protein SETIT_5G042000v2 [Setaria italica]TKW12501.1 hypothetical protein SEVIR_5G039800v2 [Setaria viridis]